MLRELTSLGRHRRGRSKLLLLCLTVVTGIILTSFRSYLHSIESQVLLINSNLYNAPSKLRQQFNAKASRPFPTPEPHLLQDLEESQLDIDEDDFESGKSPTERTRVMKSEVKQVNKEHEFRKDGLVQVNPLGSHPIYQLIENAEKRWAEKQASGSKTLDQAVKEYVRRYKRQPPLGFDHWWRYVRQNDVQLPDEYDTIYKDLEPFWGIDPTQLGEAIDPTANSIRFSYTLAKKDWNSPMAVVGNQIPRERQESMLGTAAYPLIALLKEVNEFIPPFRAAFLSSDNPEFLVDYSWKDMALEAAAKGEVLRFEDFPRSKGAGFALMCPPDSPLTLNPPRIGENPTFRTEKTFVHDIEAAADPCQNPHLLLVHGQYTRKREPPQPYRPLIPFFAPCKSSLHADIRVVPLYLTHQFVHDDYAWANKINDKLMWRGSATGAWHSVDKPWRNAHRARLLNVTATKKAPAGEGSFPDDIELLPPTPSKVLPVGNPQKVSRRAINADRMDIAFVGDNLHCEPDVCELLHEAFRYTGRLEQETAKDYKYLLDVDGHGWSGRFHRLLSMNSAIFKGTIYPEWFTGRIEPWLHYIPIQADYADLYDTFVFFAGDHKGHEGREDLAEKIGAEGRDWTDTFWRPEDMRAYMFRLLLEYARVMHPNRTEMYYGSPKTALDFN